MKDHHRKLGKSKGESFSEPTERAWPCWHINFRLTASRTIREYSSCCTKPQVCDTLLWQPQKMTIPFETAHNSHIQTLSPYALACKCLWLIPHVTITPWPWAFIKCPWDGCNNFPSSLLPHLYYTPKQTSFKSRSLLTMKNNKTRQSFLFPLNNRNQLQSPNHGESSHSVLDWLQSTSVTHCFLCGHLLMYLMGVFCIWMLPHRLGPLHLPERCFSVLLCLCFPPFLPFSPYSFSHLMNSFYHKKYFNWHPHCEVFQFIFKVSHPILILPQPLLIIFMFIYNFWFMSVFLTQRQEPSFTLYHLQQHHRPRRLWTTSPEEMSTLLTSF